MGNYTSQNKKNKFLFFGFKGFKKTNFKSERVINMSPFQSVRLAMAALVLVVG